MIPHRPSILARVARWFGTALSIGVLLSSLTNENAPLYGGLALDPENGSTNGSPVDEGKLETPPTGGGPNVGSVNEGKEAYSADMKFKSCNREPISDSQRFIMVVSTMDGKVTALNGLDGLMQWSLSTGTGPLLSSSISQLVSTRDGLPARLIPALDGSLYQLDVDGIEPVPLSADMLLSSSYRLSEDAMVVGGKDIETYALDLSAGKVLYICSSAGCKYFDSRANAGAAGRGYDAGQRFGSRARSSIIPDTDVLVVKRTGKTVRAVDILSGHEKWNYSVAQHDVTYLRRSGYQQQQGPSAAEQQQQHSCQQQWTAAEGDDSSYRDATVEDVLEDGGQRYSWSFNMDPTLPDPSDIDLKVSVPSGLVEAVSRSNPGVVLWRYKFDTSIASAWVVNGHRLTDISLFDDRHVPALDQNRRLAGDHTSQTTTPGWSGGDHGEGGRTTDMSNPALLPPEPLIYVGTYNNQLYVQPSVRLVEEIEEAELEAASRRGQVSAISMPRVRWKPYIATAPSRTPSVSANDRGDAGGPLLIGGEEEEELSLETALAPWHEQYPFDTGYYLYSDYSPIRLPLISDSTDPSALKDDEVNFSVSLINWWKEVVAISIVTSICFHLFCHVLVRKIYPRGRSCVEAGLSRQGSSFREAAIDQSQGRVRSKHSSECEIELVEEKSKAGSNDSGGGGSRNASTSDQVEYISRYLTDFEQKACLGRGGFGVVFSVVNRLDDCEYAIKRITLTDSEVAREKVMREVKALAKLDHPGIVRYYQSWFERPPPGWQEQIDKICIDMSLATPTNGLNPASATSIGSTDLGGTGDPSRSRAVRPVGHNPLRPFDMFSGPLGAGFNDSPSYSEHVGRRDVVLDISSTGDSSRAKAENSRRAGRCRAREENTRHGNTADDISWSEDGGGGGMRLEDDDDDDESSSLDSGFSLRHTSCQRGSNLVRISSDRFSGTAEDDSLEICFRDESVSGGNGNSKSGTGKISISGSTSSRRNCQLARSVDAPASSHNEESFSIVFSNDISKSRQENPSVVNAAVERSPGSSSRSRCRSVPVNRPNSLSLSPDDISTNHNRERQREGRVKVVTDSSSACKGPPPAKLYLYIQMQLCRTDSLKDWLNNNTLNRDRAQLVEMFYQIVSAISYVHESGLMHRDLKPSNIFFAMNGSVKIGDFGLVTAAVTEEGEEGVASLVTPMSNVSSHRPGKHTDQVGTQLYMSPEQCAGLTYTHKVDIYALGMIFFELFYPFSTQMERVDTLRGVRLLRFPQRFTRELNPQYEFVRHLLSHNPVERPSTHEILEHPLLQELEVERSSQRYQCKRNSSSNTSSSSNSAASNSEIISNPPLPANSIGNTGSSGISSSENPSSPPLAVSNGNTAVEQNNLESNGDGSSVFENQLSVSSENEVTTDSTVVDDSSSCVGGKMINGNTAVENGDLVLDRAAAAAAAAADSNNTAAVSAACLAAAAAADNASATAAAAAVISADAKKVTTVAATTTAIFASTTTIDNTTSSTAAVSVSAATAAAATDITATATVTVEVTSAGAAASTAGAAASTAVETASTAGAAA